MLMEKEGKKKSRGKTVENKDAYNLSKKATHASHHTLYNKTASQNSVDTRSFYQENNEYDTS